MKKLSELGEFGLIDRIRRALPSGRALVGIGDDAAVLPLPAGNVRMLFCSDAVIEGVHFTSAASPRLVGRKALAVNLSDIAAMGGVPLWAVINLGLPRSATVSYCDGLYRGLGDLGREWGVEVVGGDTFLSPQGVILAPAVVGWVEKDKYLRRSGARPGDLILVTGRLGECPATKHLVFTPRLREGRFLATRFPPTAMIDLSDGLFADLQKLCAAGGVGAEIHASSLPVTASAAGKGLKTILKTAGRGEEFELLFTLSPRRVKGLLRAFRTATGTEATVIGRILADPNRMEVLGPGGKRERLPGWGWDHFAVPAGRKGGGK